MQHNHSLNMHNRQKTFVVIILTLATMAAEILYGYLSNSMGLLADGYHMGTHTFALGIAYVAYFLAEHYNSCNQKIETLAGYTSSIFLGFSGIYIIYEAINRIFNPVSINFNEAILVTIIGLFVNCACILIMGKSETTDFNFKAAYYHILADTLTSIFAIFALLAGKYFDIIYLDPLAGILSGVLIISWSYELLRETFLILVDFKPLREGN